VWVETQRGKIKGVKGIYWVMQTFLYVETFYTAGAEVHVWGRLQAWWKTKHHHPLPCSLSASRPVPLTCIAGLVGVKIDWQCLNWKWSLNAACSCWGFEFSVTPASQPAHGEDWWGACRGTEQRSHRASWWIVHISVPWEPRTECGGQGQTQWQLKL
jgi:hypothetical protein